MTKLIEPSSKLKALQDIFDRQQEQRERDKAEAALCAPVKFFKEQEEYNPTPVQKLVDQHLSSLTKHGRYCGD